MAFSASSFHGQLDMRAAGDARGAQGAGGDERGGARAAHCDLPAAVWEAIADHLTNEDLLELRLVCSAWRGALGALVRARGACGRARHAGARPMRGCQQSLWHCRARRAGLASMHKPRAGFLTELFSRSDLRVTHALR